MTVLIGKGRRITLSELQSVCLHDGVLEMHSTVTTESQETDASSNKDISDGFSNLSLQEEESSSSSSSSSSSPMLKQGPTLATLTLLSLSLSQIGKYNDASSVLVDLVNHIKSSVSTEMELFPSDPSAFATRLLSILSTSSTKHTPSSSSPLLPSSTELTSVFKHILPLARNALSVYRVHTLTRIVDALACLSAERVGIDPSIWYSDSKFDGARPHRGMIDSAHIMRCVLQGSRRACGGGGDCKAIDDDDSKKRKDDDVGQVSDMIQSVRSVPQYHGPAVDAIKGACKVLELECNCISLQDSSSGHDNTVMNLAATNAMDATIILLQGCVSRTNNESLDDAVIISNNNNNNNQKNCTESMEHYASLLEQKLYQECATNIDYINEETKIAFELAKKKADEKAARAAAHTTPKTPANSEDEFKGMTEAQKAKILKKRAQKEAKAAKKAAAKKGASSSSSSSSPFSSGTMQIIQVLSEIQGGAQSSTTTTNNTIPSSISSSPTYPFFTPIVIHSIEIILSKLLSGGIQRKPKIAKGTRDYLPEQMMIRDEAFQIIRRVFKSHGAVEIDTPVFELKDTLTGKYGEDSKLIYDLADQGGEMLALRYDLTVPFARFLALNSVGNIKRFHIGKVYRRDQPALARGRYREFYQCDFDIAGNYGRMVPDSECLCVASEILSSLPIGNFGIKLNHRRLLDAILDICGVPSDKFRTICSAVDKLDKEPWSEVRREMVEDKGLDVEAADKIGKYVLRKGSPWDMYSTLMREKAFGNHQGAAEAMEDLNILFQYLDAMDKLHYISFDLSLARGLDYYTGVIYEAVCMNGNTQVGSIGGGGRYDNLVSMFQEAGKITPCVGVSVGIERVFTLMEERLRSERNGSISRPNVNVLVAQAGENMMIERMKLSKLLWNANISAEFNQQPNPKLKFEIANALDRDIPYMVIVGEEESKVGKCKIKDLQARTEETVDQINLVSTLRKKGVIPVGCEFAAQMMSNASNDA